MFEKIQAAPPDSILGLTEAFKNDPRPNKVNLGVGVYKDEQGATPVLATVKAAEQKLLAEEKTKSYLPIEGEPAFGRLTQGLVFGEKHPIPAAGRAKTAHTPGGTGALRVGGDFLKKFRPDATVWLSAPTWANHRSIFEAAHLKTAEYAYYDPSTSGLNFKGMADALAKVPAGDIVLLHACCHNPTGVDLAESQWREVTAIAAKQKWMPFVDFAYQGFGESVEADRRCVEILAEDVPEFLVASSFSKNLGLYRERVGALTLVGADAASAESAFSHVKIAIRTNYSNPAAHGGLIAQTVLGEAGLRADWLKEVEAMRKRIATVRQNFVDGMKQAGVRQDFSYIVRQKGMFSFSGLTDAQVQFLKEKKAIYVVKGGRINVAGITAANLGYLCESVKEALAG